MENLKGMGQKMAGPGRVLGGLATTLLGAAGVAYVGYNSLYTVDGGHRAVMFNRVTGVRPEVVGEGTHIMIPWFEWPTVYDIRTRPKKISSPTGTRDMQTVNITLRVLYKPRANDLPSIHKRFGADYDERVLPSIVNETLKSIIVSFWVQMVCGSKLGF
jgi:prohibitin 2